MAKFIARLWQTVRQQRHLVGRDLEGNKFYESTVDGVDPRRTRRTVEYKGGGDLWDTATGISHLPAQWSAWLAHTRANPPTLDELKTDRARQERVAFNVARLKEKEEEDRRRSQAPPAIPQWQLDPPGESLSESISPQAPPSRPIGPTPEPQSWIPHSARRR